LITDLQGHMHDAGMSLSRHARRHRRLANRLHERDVAIERFLVKLERLAASAIERKIRIELHLYPPRLRSANDLPQSALIVT
jgi:hypothetical protein